MHRQIESYGDVYNHCIAFHKRYYRLFGKFLSANRLKLHLTKLKQLAKFQHWNELGSQAIQDIVERIDRAYQLFFRNLKHGIKTAPPTFKSRHRYKSFTLKQAEWKWLGNGYIRIGKRIYRYWDCRPIEGTSKTCTIKRDSLGDFYIFVVIDALNIDPNPTMTGKSAGFDFGLKTYLTASDGQDVESPLFFKRGIRTIKQANRQLSRRKRGSHNRYKARLNLARKHRKIANQRHDFHWKLAHQLTDEYDTLFFETLNLKGMKRLWGRKVSDLGFGAFVEILKSVASKKGKSVHFISQWLPSLKTRSECGGINDTLELGERVWQCPSCHAKLARDRNAAINIHRVGASTLF